ncbi:unnamed protein product [Bemisia tabaci]|uniref:C2H2-type domain-containing protein n=1 Tax=Bemisia tabaci TaxID=7038 RepID=A0A9N9ZZZ7_BEMTA|nr:PREDICTED: longitudinals lacking protein-like [Bemisia tabaci]CAH0381227.1 unnamed protein product [Bemisia tabaci]
MATLEMALYFSEEKSFLEKLNEHRVVIDDRPFFKCFKCNKCYSSKYTLARHINYECGLPPCFQCPKCPYRSKRKDHMKSHMNGVHRSDLSTSSAYAFDSLNAF